MKGDLEGAKGTEKLICCCLYVTLTSMFQLDGFQAWAIGSFYD